MRSLVTQKRVPSSTLEPLGVYTKHAAVASTHTCSRRNRTQGVVLMLSHSHLKHGISPPQSVKACGSTTTESVCGSSMKSAEASVPQGVWSLEVVSSNLNLPILSPWGEGFIPSPTPPRWLGPPACWRVGVSRPPFGRSYNSQEASKSGRD